MADQQEHKTTTDLVDKRVFGSQSKPALDTAPTVVSPSENQGEVENFIISENIPSISHSTTSVNSAALEPASESHHVPFEPEQKGVTGPVVTAPHGSDEPLAFEAGSKETSIERDPSIAIEASTNGESLGNSNPANHAPSGTFMETNQAMVEDEPGVLGHPVGDSVHSSSHEPDSQARQGQSLQLNKISDHERPELVPFPTENLAVPHNAEAEVAPSPGPAAIPKEVANPKELEITAPARIDALQTYDLDSISQEPSKASIEEDALLWSTEPILEALPQSEAFVTENPASAVAAINNAASELDQIMEQHDLNKSYEVQNTSFDDDLNSLGQAPPGPVSETLDPAQQNDKTLPGPVHDVPLAGEPSPLIPTSVETHAPLDVHEPIEAHPGTETPADSAPAHPGVEPPTDSAPEGAEMDDGSSVSTIHAYLGAPSLGTGSVNGDPDDTLMDDGDSALGDDVESYV